MWIRGDPCVNLISTLPSSMVIREEINSGSSSPDRAQSLLTQGDNTVGQSKWTQCPSPSALKGETYGLSHEEPWRG